MAPLALWGDLTQFWLAQTTKQQVKGSLAEHVKRKRTLPDDNYFDGGGKRQSLFNRIYKAHIQDKGKPNTGGKYAEFVYALYQILEEYYDHGFQNAMSGNAFDSFENAVMEIMLLKMYLLS